MRTNKVIIYGVRGRGSLLCKTIWESRCGLEIVAVVDSNPQLWGTRCYGQIVAAPDTVLREAKYPVCIAVATEKAAYSIRDTLIHKYQYPAEMIWDYISLMLEIWNSAVVARTDSQCSQNTAPGQECIIGDLFNGFTLGGIESWVKALFQALMQRGWQNLRICVNKDRYRGKRLPAEWNELSKIADCIGNDPEQPLAQPLLQNSKDYFVRQRPCVIVTNWLETLCAACSAKKLYFKQIKIIAVIHGGHRRLFDEYAKLLDDVDVFVGVSQDIQRAMIERGIEAERVLLMHIPFQCDELLERSYTEESSKPIKLGYAGRISIASKRMDILLRMIEVLEIRSVDFRLEIAGTGEYETEIRSFITEHHLEKRVFLLGKLPREEIAAFWKRQDVCVNISDHEGRSISITEAMGNGAIPVVTDVSGVRDDIIDGRNGYIVPVGDYRGMADRIEYLAAHRELLPAMGQAAHDDIYPTSLTEPHVRFWEELLSREISSIRNHMDICQ